MKTTDFLSNCPLCGEAVDDAETHFYRHMGYRRFMCNSCPEKFFTEKKRDEHCQKESHSRSFQKIVNPYIELIVDVLLKDVEHLAAMNLDTLIAIRQDANRRAEEKLGEIAKSNSRKEKSFPKPKQKEKECTASSLLKSPPSRSSKKNYRHKLFEDDSEDEHDDPVPNVLSPKQRISSQAKQRSSSDNLCDSTTTTGKDSILSDTTLVLANVLNSEFGLNSAETETTCSLCKFKLHTDYLSRRSHVTLKHMGHDIEECDYQDILQSQMEAAFPGLANSDNSCQLCKKEVFSLSGRKQHVEYYHFMSAPQSSISCPIADCVLSFVRQGELSLHLRKKHDCKIVDLPISPRRSREFQGDLKKRNETISSLQTHCFPCDPLHSKKYTHPGRSPAIHRLPTTVDMRFARQPNPLRATSESSSSSDDSDSEVIQVSANSEISRSRNQSEGSVVANASEKRSEEETNDCDSVVKEETHEISVPISHGTPKIKVKQERIYVAENTYNDASSSKGSDFSTGVSSNDVQGFRAGDEFVKDEVSLPQREQFDVRNAPSRPIPVSRPKQPLLPLPAFPVANPQPFRGAQPQSTFNFVEPNNFAAIPLPAPQVQPLRLTITPAHHYSQSQQPSQPSAHSTNSAGEVFARRNRINSWTERTSDGGYQKHASYYSEKETLGRETSSRPVAKRRRSSSHSRNQPSFPERSTEQLQPYRIRIPAATNKKTSNSRSESKRSSPRKKPSNGRTEMTKADRRRMRMREEAARANGRGNVPQSKRNRLTSPPKKRKEVQELSRNQVRKQRKKDAKKEQLEKEQQNSWYRPHPKFNVVLNKNK